MTKRSKRRHLYTKTEFLFNLFSLLLVIGVGVYFGYRSLYYYSKQSMIHKGNNQKLSEVIINSNKLITDGDGFHRDKQGYYFKGNVGNNYLKFANRMFRIVRINNDGSIRIVADNIVTSFMRGEDEYEKSNLYTWLEKTDDPNSGIYYNTIPNIEDFLVKTKYSEDILKDDKVSKNKTIKESYITMLGINDYVLANGKNSYLNNGQIYHLLGKNSDNSNLYIEEDGSVNESDSIEAYGVKTVITLKKNTISAFGDGSADNPYTVEQKSKTNYVDSIVRLGNDTWRVYKEESDKLRLVKVDYLKNNNTEVKYRFSKEENTFDLEDQDGLAVYLNNNYFNSLSYKDVLVDNDYYTGELSIETDYKYQSIYSDKVTCKVGLLNIFDYNTTHYDDYYLVNTYQGNLQYIRYKNGLLGEAEMTEEKHIIPVISINKNSIKEGQGTFDNPYITG